MCGIFGFIGSIPEAASEEAYNFLKHVFVQSKERGTHASGFAAIHRDSPLTIDKRAVSADKFVWASSRFKALKQKMPTMFIGHTRHATTGIPSRGRNNHPFNSNRYTMVHNGHIDDWDKLAKAHPIQLRSETDSEVIIRLLDEKPTMEDGVQHVINTVDKDSKIAIAVIKHDDAANRRLFLFRKDNPISVLTVPAWKAIFFASTDKILDDAMKSCWGLMIYQQKRTSLKMEIATLPTWALSEFTLTGETPHLVSSVKIEEQKTSSNISRLDSLLPIKSVDGVRPGPGVGPSQQHGDTTGLSPATQADMVRFHQDAHRTAKLMNLMSSEPFMTLDEIEDWRVWLKASV